MDPNLSKDENQASSTSHVVVPPPPADPVISAGIPPAQSPLPATAVPSNPSAPVLPPGVTIPAPQAPVEPQAAASEPPSSVPPGSDNQSFQDLPKKRRVNAKVASVLVALLIVAAVPLTVFLTNQQQNTKSGAAPDVLTTNPEVTNFNGNPIHICSTASCANDNDSSDIYHVALENYSADQLTANNNEALVNARDTWAERQILDAQVTNQVLTEPSQSDIDSMANDLGLSQIQARYILLKQEAVQKEVKWVKLVSIGYWTPPASNVGMYSSDDQNAITKENQEGAIAMQDAFNQLNSGADALTVAQAIYNNSAYPNLKPILSLNGTKLSEVDAQDLQTIAQPNLYEFGDTNFDDSTRSLVFGASDEQTVSESTNDPSNGGRVVYKIIDKGTTGTFNSYTDWLNHQENGVYIKVGL